MKILKTILILTLAFFAFTACETAKKLMPANETAKTETPKDANAETDDAKDEKVGCDDVEWTSTRGENGPENWEKLCDAYKKCGGKTQSPINIVTEDAKTGEDLSAIKFDYAESEMDIENTGHTIHINVPGKNKITIGEKEYKLMQFHYHAASEHTVDGKQFPLEIHFVHLSTDDKFAVISALFEEGAESELFKNYLSDFPPEKSKEEVKGKVDLMSLLPNDKAYFNYDGSLTTPPCSEGVKWYVLKNPVTASKEQLDTFAKILNSDFRPIMPLNGREVKTFSE